MFPKIPEWAHFSWQMQPVGSRITCNPPPTDTDEDWLVCGDAEIGEQLLDQGFLREGLPGFYTGNDRGSFVSYRRGDLNVIVTPQIEFYDLFLTATELAKRFNLLSKSDRIALFQAVLYDVGVNNLQQSKVKS